MATKKREESTRVPPLVPLVVPEPLVVGPAPLVVVGPDVGPDVGLVVALPVVVLVGN
jgi:hypothetical protein